MKKLLSILLVLAMVVSMVALSACESDPAENSGATSNTSTPVIDNEDPDNDNEDDENTAIEFEVVPGDIPEGTVIEEFAPGTYTYDDYVSTLATNWNVHTYQSTDDAYPQDFLMVGLYTFFYNDALHPIQGRDEYQGYKIVPEMAADAAIDVTEQYKGQFGIPEDAVKGYAHKIALNPNAKWQNGVAINADTYIYSMQQLLNPDLLNYRAADYYANDLCIAGAEYYANQGQSSPNSISSVIEKDGLADLDAFLAAYGEANAYINWDYSFGAQYDAESGEWGSVVDSGVVDTGMALKDFVPFYISSVVEFGYSDEAGATEWVYDEIYAVWSYPADVSFDTVGCLKTGDYEITLILGKPLNDFYLYYNLTGNWLVYEELYEANKHKEETAAGEVWYSTYCSSVETTMSYGPYKMTQYIADSGMKFEKNENWYGHTDNVHVYQDPEDGLNYRMYQTDIINTRVVAETATAKEMFLSGQLIAFGLGADDFDEYRDSERSYTSPSETIYFMIFNGHKDAIEEREQAADFDTTTTDLQTMTLLSFRKAFALVYDKNAFAANVSPARSGGFALLGESFIYDPATGARYRDHDYAKQTLLDFYGVDAADFDGDLDAAIDSITGYDPAQAKTLFTEAFNEAIEKGYITDADSDGKSDQTVQITYNVSTRSSFIENTVAYMNTALADVIKDTPFEGKIEIVLSADRGTEWVNFVRGGLDDLCLAGWSGSAMNPYSLMEVYVNPTNQYNAQWFDSTTVELTIKVPVPTGEEGETEEKELTANLRDWVSALSGSEIEFKDGTKANFGDGFAAQDVRVLILAKVEGAILSTYDYIPLLQNASMSLLSYKVFYVIEDYNPVMGRGGIAYLKYNYNDADWTKYVADQGGQLKY